jgi:hypothetical protein
MTESVAADSETKPPPGWKPPNFTGAPAASDTRAPNVGFSPLAGVSTAAGAGWWAGLLALELAGHFSGAVLIRRGWEQRRAGDQGGEDGSGAGWHDGPRH